MALSFQFFNKTRQNILARPHATLLLLHPQTSAFYRLQIRHLHTETEGPLFESMRAQPAGIASRSGMAEVFAPKGSDLYKVLAIEAVPGTALSARCRTRARRARCAAAASSWRAAAPWTRRLTPSCAP